jgi:hypothetical protein
MQLALRPDVISVVRFGFSPPCNEKAIDVHMLTMKNRQSLLNFTDPWTLAK